MPTSAVLVAKRDLVKNLRRIADKYGVRLAFDRDSDAGVLLRAYKDVALKAHPHKGGDFHDMKLLTTSRQAWESARQAAGEGKGGRPVNQAPRGRAQAAVPAASLTSATHGSDRH